MPTAERLGALLAQQSRHPWRWMAAIALMLAVQITPWWIPTPDAVAYLSIARSIALHRGLRMFGYAHIAYPPGYPLLISPAFWLGPLPFLALAILQWLIAIVFIGGLYRWTLRQVPRPMALPLTALVMVNVTLWIYYRRTLSELAFMAVAIWAVYFLDSALDATPGRHRLPAVLLGATMLILLTLIREVGALFALALALSAWRRVRAGELARGAAVSTLLAVLIPVGAAAAGFVIYSERSFAATHMFGTHMSALFDSRVPWFSRLLDGMRLQICGIGRLLVPGMFKAYGHTWGNLNTLLYGLIFAPIAVGWWRWVKRRPDIYALVVPFYLLTYALWDFDADTRYALPILPAAVVSLWYLLEPFMRLRSRLIAALIGLHLAVALGYWVAVERPRARECHADWEPIARLASKLRGQAGPIAATDDVAECSRLLLSFMLDRPVPRLRGSLAPGWSVARSLPPADRPAVILVTVGRPPIDGYQPETIAAHYFLMVEAPPTAAR